MKNIESRLAALESAADDTIRVIRIGGEACCDGPDEATARRNANVPPDFQGTLICVHYVREPT